MKNLCGTQLLINKVLTKGHNRMQVERDVDNNPE